VDNTVELDIDVAYRRGFDQAIAFLLLDAGASQNQINKLLYKKRLAAWRAEGKGWIHDLRQDAPRVTEEEYSEILSCMNCLYMGEEWSEFNA
jgi:hypothetical protein